jgi:hypothetical protein
LATDRLSLHCTIMAVAGAERIEGAQRQPALPSECAWMLELAGRRKDARRPIPLFSLRRLTSRAE